MNIYNKQIINPLLSKGIQQVYKEKNVVNVYAASDFPAVLETDTVYVVNGLINIGSSLNIFNEGISIVGRGSREKDGLIYTGAFTLFNVLDVNFSIDNLYLSATSSGAKLMDARNYTPAAFNEGRTKVLTVTNSQIKDCFDVFDIEGFDLVDLQNNLFWYIKATNHGLRFLNTSKIEISSCEFIRWFDITTIPTPGNFATVPMLEIQPNGAGVGVGACIITSSLFHPQQTQDAIKIDNASTTGFGTISSNTFVTVGLTTGVIANFDYNIQNSYIIQANQSLQNGNAKGILSLSNNLIELNNSAAAGPPYSVVVNDANFVGGTGPTSPIIFPIAQRVLTSASNASFTYDSKITGNFAVNLNATVGVNSNGTFTITVQFRQNGTPLPLIGKTTIRNSGGVFVGQPVGISIQGTANQGDVFDVLISCDQANNVLLSELLISGYQF